jgi:hypothetical protein
MSNESLLKDVDQREWGSEELQALVLQVGSFGKTALRLGLPEHVCNAELRKRGIMPPPEFVRTIAKADPVAFRDSIIREGSIEKASKWFGVSTTHLKKVMDEVGIKHRKITPSKEDAEKALNLFGSALLAARLLGTTPNEIKKACPEWRDFRDPLRTGRQAVATGRIGEDYWKSLRGMQTLEEFIYQDPNHPGYDFIDQEFGKVNVKTANPNQEKRSKNWAWTWEINPTQDADTFPLVFLDRNRRPFYHLIVTRVGTEFSFPPTLRVVKWTNGCYGISIKSSKDHPSDSDWVKEDLETST